MRQLGRPALLAATYKGDAAGIAFAAMEEVEGTLVNCLRELERLSLLSGGIVFGFCFMQARDHAVRMNNKRLSLCS